MKLFFIISILLAGTCSTSIYASCGDKVVNGLFDELSPYLSWVDVNPQSNTGRCLLTIRYYPCVPNIKDLVLTAVKRLPFECVITSRGIPIKIEGYCALSDVALYCVR